MLLVPSSHKPAVTAACKFMSLSAFSATAAVNHMQLIGPKIAQGRSRTTIRNSTCFACYLDRACTLQMVKVKNFNARDDESIKHLIHRSNLVVNCIGIQKETMNWSFQETHVDIAAKIAEACKENEMVERFWHVGCLGANENSTSRRLQSKV